VDRAIIVGFRVTEAEARKVEELARQTHRSKSGVLRLLLRQAEMETRPDIRLQGREEEGHG